MQWRVRGARVRVCVCEREGRTGAASRVATPLGVPRSQSHSPAAPIPQACDRRSPTATREEAGGAARMLRVYARRTAARADGGGGVSAEAAGESAVAAEQAGSRRLVYPRLAVFGRSRRRSAVDPRSVRAGCCASWRRGEVAAAGEVAAVGEGRRGREPSSVGQDHGERLGSRRCRRPSLPLFCGTRSARREAGLLSGAPRVGPSAVDPRPVRACEWLAVRVLLAPTGWHLSGGNSQKPAPKGEHRVATLVCNRRRRAPPRRACRTASARSIASATSTSG